MALFIYLIIFSTEYSKAKNYMIKNVEIIEPYGVNFKKNKIIDKAFKSAFNILIAKIVISDDLNEVKYAVDIIKNNNKNCKIILLHCVSLYPCEDKNVRLKRINSLKNIHDNIGISDHTPDSLSSILSIPFGIEAIEKHFTISRKLKGPDHKSSLEPSELSIMINNVREMEKALGKIEKKITKS